MMRKPLTSCLILLLGTLLASTALGVQKVAVLGLFKDKAIVNIDGKQRVLKVGQTSPEGVTLISADSAAAVLEIDGQQGTYKLGSHIASTFKPAPEKTAVRIWPDGGGMYLVTGTINGYPVKFLVDTGATYIAMNSGEARRMGIDYLLEGRRGMSSTASGVVTTYYVMLDRVRIGDITLSDVQAAVIDGAFPTEVLLGNSFLNRLDMRREGRALELRTKF